MYELHNLVKFFGIPYLWVQSDSKISVELQSRKEMPINFRDFAPTIDYIITVPIWKLRDAAYRYQMQIRTEKSISSLSVKSL